MPRSINSKASRDVRPTVQRYIRCLLSSGGAGHPEPSLKQSPKQPPPPSPPPLPKTIDLDDHTKLYASFTTAKLMKSWLTLKVAAKGSVAAVGSWVINSRAMDDPIAKAAILGFTERTFFGHFCGGKDLLEAGRTVQMLWDTGLNAMLDYGLEHSDDNLSCDRNLAEFLASIEWTKSLPNSQCVSFIVVKITAICPTSLLRRLSDLLRWEYKRGSIDLPWKQETLPIFTDISPLYHTIRCPAPLTPEEERDLQIAIARLETICERSVEANVPLLIDAEETTTQPAIDYLAYSAAIKYRLPDGKPLIFNTIQAYLKDSFERLKSAMGAADRIGVPLGIKLVRGAYMSSEKILAANLRADHPLHPVLERTHDSYNDCADFLLNEVAKGKASAVMATHNIESGYIIAGKARQLGIAKEDPSLQFAQLYGMSDALSFGLKNAGFKVSKYLPFGPVEQIMPYLLRRAEENTAVLGTSNFDRDLMKKEWVRRLKSGIRGEGGDAVAIQT
ncbi:proline dehydrogenase 2, mitochondrial-like [Andrographis paniculata]|uniref:proline dehydrogenase 2, mitochondrial-like n=1 Tax=Andrographis paniculata TaxID=175694 RepID=UPI0021E7B338|nr:proline dehydrogenase 2, mitochondrial-like [Andrographis paniculata]